MVATPASPLGGVQTSGASARSPGSPLDGTLAVLQAMRRAQQERAKAESKAKVEAEQAKAEAAAEVEEAAHKTETTQPQIVAAGSCHTESIPGPGQSAAAGAVASAKAAVASSGSSSKQSKQSKRPTHCREWFAAADSANTTGGGEDGCNTTEPVASTEEIASAISPYPYQGQKRRHPPLSSPVLRNTGHETTNHAESSVSGGTPLQAAESTSTPSPYVMIKIAALDSSLYQVVRCATQPCPLQTIPEPATCTVQEVKRRHLSSLDTLVKALARGLPCGTVPTVQQLQQMRMKYSLDEHGEHRISLNPADDEAVRRSAGEACGLYIWPRKKC